ncbi:MAG: hypothetical protein M0036_21100 [Desulfobacteraceae bacterium]|nr:hypothetical protein [Desulfobacteraceae bacterium]
MQRIIRTALFALAGIVALTGCATTGTLVAQNLLSTGMYKKEFIPDPETYFTQVWAVEDKGQLRVSGNLRLKGFIGLNVPDYVEVALLKPDGAIIDAKKVAFYPQHLHGHEGHMEARFRATFAQAPEAGTTIRLSNVN